MRYVYRDGDWRNPSTNEPMDVPDTPAVPYIASDIKPYRSMVSGKMIDGRAAQREDLKQSGCRVADPSEWKIETARTKKWADRFKVDHVPDKGPERLPEVV
jgi:isopropylmalate/homocitrate/citramalate synthase